MARRFNGFPAECIQDWTLLAESHGVYTSACITEDSTLVYRVFPVPIDRCVPSRHRGIRSYLFYVNQLLKTGYNRLGFKPILLELAKVWEFVSRRGEGVETRFYLFSFLKQCTGVASCADAFLHTTFTRTV